MLGFHYVGGTSNGALPDQTLGSAGVDDVFLRKYDANGNEVWTRQFGSARTDQAFDVATGIANVFIVGRTNGTLIGQTSAGAFDGFIRRFDFNGTLNGTIQFGTASNEELSTVDVGTDGFFVGGSTGGTFPGQIRAGGLTDAFVVKFDFNLNPVWTRQFGTTGDDTIHAAFAYLTGTTGVQVVGSVGGTLSGFINRGGIDAFRRRLDSNGIEVNLDQFGSAGNDAALAINNSYFGGSSGGSLAGLTSLGGTDAFIVKLATLLKVDPTTLRVSAVVGAATERRAMRVSGGGLTQWNATLEILNGSGWLTASPLAGGAVTVAGEIIHLDFNYAALPGPGVYQAVITVKAGGLSSVVPISVVLSLPLPNLTLNRSDFVFRVQQGAATSAVQSLEVFNSGIGTLNWSIPSSTAFPTWLRLSSFGSAVPGGTSTRTNISVNHDGTPPGVYQTVLPVTATGALNNPQQVVVTLQVVPANTPPSADLSVNGVIFIAAPGSTSQTRSLNIGNAGAGGLTFQLQAATTSGGNWLSVTPVSGNAGSGPISVQLTVNPALVAPGIHRGRITGTYSDGPAPEVEVVMVVTPVSALTQRDAPGAAACGGTTMDLVATSIGNGVSLPVSFPRTILAQLVDNCGIEVDSASAFANIEGLSLPMSRVGPGTYRAAWTPERPLAALQIVLSATHPAYGTVEKTYTVSTTVAAGGVSLPVLAQDGVVEGAGFTRLRPLAPGSIVSIFGSQFATENNFATVVPLSRTLGGTSVIIGGEEAPLYFVGPGQINAQVPFDLRPGDNVSIAINAGGRITAPQSYLIAPNQPGIFQSQGVAAVLDAQFRNINDQNPAAVGAVLQIFANGLGVVDQPVASGTASPSFSRTLLPVSVTVGGVPVPVLYQGLAPGFVGLYQVNVQLTSGVPGGGAVPIVIQQDGIDSNPHLPVSIPIR